MPRAMGGEIVWTEDGRLAWVIPAGGEVCLCAVANGGRLAIPARGGA